MALICYSVKVLMLKTQFILSTSNRACAVDKLLFLKHRASLSFTSCVLVSSEQGFLKFWTFEGKDNLGGKFYASAFADQACLSLATDPDNRVLVSGDTLGFVYVWDIETFGLGKSQPAASPPACIASWRAHDSAVVALEYIAQSAGGIYAGELVLTASTDRSCRLWTGSGEYVGVFGQEARWSLGKAYTFQGAISQRNKKLASLRKARSESKNGSPGGSFISGDSSTSLKRAVNKVIAVDSMKPRRLDKLAGLRAFGVRSASVEYDVERIGEFRAARRGRPLKKVYSKASMEIDSYTSLPIHEFSSYVRQEQLKEAFERMSVKLPRIGL